MGKLTVVMAIYGQPLMLQTWFKTIAEYDKESRSKIKMIIVDDHGDPPTLPPEAPPCELEIYRIDDDINWNQMGARNLGMKHASGWCVMVDPDMVIDVEQILLFLKRVETAERGVVIKYGLRHRTGHKVGLIDMASPNAYIIHRDDFFMTGGYDEEYRGHKGWSDVQMLDVLRAHFKVLANSKMWAQFYGSGEISDAAIMHLDRDVKVNRALRINKRRLVNQLGGWKKWAKKHKGPNLRFKWHKVYPSP